MTRDEDAPLASLPVVLPRLITFSLGGSLIGRTFAFNAPLQKESTFPRPGIAVALETYPLIRFGHGWLRTLGMGASLAMEFGAAALKNSATGATASFPVSQRRYSIDVRYVLLAGRRVAIIPALGIGNNTFDLKNNMPVVPSACTSMPAMPMGIALPCLADVQATYLIADLHLRVAATERLAFDLSGGYFLGMAVGRGLGQIGQEKVPTMSGVRGELGATLMLSDWLAVRMAIPVVNYKFTFNSGGPAYTSAAESYYGGTVSGVLFTR